MSVIRECMGKYDWDHDRRVGVPDRRKLFRSGNEEQEKQMAKEVSDDQSSRIANNIQLVDRRARHINPVRIRRAAA